MPFATRNLCRWAGLAALTMLLTACVAPPYPPHDSGEPRTVVLWISVDGFRGDYLERAATPFFDEMTHAGAHTLALAPIFPSLTFPNHVSQVTGVAVDRHGVPMNSFYDTERDEVFIYPGNPELLQAEPIWTTAQRQGLRVAVHDWVLSHRQQGEHAAAYFRDRYDDERTDTQRLRLLLKTWRRDRSSAPLQLIMGYVPTVDKVGHTFGPDAPEIADAVARLDKQLNTFLKQAQRIFNQRMNPERDELWLILTSDHGMAPVHTAVNPRTLTGITREEDNGDDMVLMPSAHLAHVFLNKIRNEAAREKRAAQIMDSAAQHDFAEVFTRDTLPEQWAYAHPTRVGDLVVALDDGYMFSRKVKGLTAPPAEVEGPLGMHGYDVAENPEMNGVLFVWRYPKPLGGRRLGDTHSLQLHATVARLLGIEPAEGARTDAIVLE